MTAAFATRFGAWGLVAGASEGLGAAFADALAARGLDLVLVARRIEPLEALAADLRARRGVQVRVVAIDLGAAAAIAELGRATAMLEIGVAIYNAAAAPNGPLLGTDPEALQRVVDVNVRGPLAFVRTFGPPMLARRRGALVLMSSIAGMQGTPRVAAYAASKAFITTLAEGLWHELREGGVDVLASCAGAIRTPGYAAAGGRAVPGLLDASDVAEITLRAVGRGPRVVPGLVNRVAAWVLARLLPRRWAIAIMASSTRSLS